MAKTDESPDCVIGFGSVFDGRFHVSGSILIEGKFQGDIRTDDLIVIGPAGQVKTDIAARKVTIAGTIIGNITATEEVNLLGSGKVLGNIRTPRLTVEEGVMTSGTVTITSGKDDDIKTLIEESYGQGADDAFEGMTGEKKSQKNRIQEDQTT